MGSLLSNINDTNSLKFDDEEKANILQNQFSSVFTHEPEGDIPRIASRTDSSISGLYVTEEMVLNQLTYSNVNKSCGSDEVHPRILIELADYIALLFNLTTKYGIIPKDGNGHTCLLSIKKLHELVLRTIGQSA